MKKIILLFACSLLWIACSNDPDPATEKANFVRVYDNNQFNASYRPLDVVQTADGGYLILGERDISEDGAPYYAGAFILKVDAFGLVVSELEVTSDKVNPLAPILRLGDKLYFFNMDPLTTQAQLSEISPNGNLVATTLVSGVFYPAAAAVDGNGFVVLGYDNATRESVVSVVSAAGTASTQKGFSIGAGDAAEEPIIEHYNRTGNVFPFQIGKTASGRYFFNGFYDYTFSLVFTDLAADGPLGRVNGNQGNGGFSQLMPLEGNRYAAATFSFGRNFLMPSVTINESAIEQVSNLEDASGLSLLELSPNATVKIYSVTIKGTPVTLFASNTVGKQIALYAYDRVAGTLLGTHYLGFSNPFEVGAVTPTADGGLAICGTTYVAGRFPRAVLFKMSAEKVNEAF